ncbi:MAG: copper resistance protein CopC [Ilumatobacteraceae bacterium]
MIRDLRVRRWRSAVAGAVLAFVALPVSLVSAHASFVQSTPVDGSVLARSPAAVELHFTEPVLIEASTVRLVHLGAQGDQALQLTSADAGTTVLAALPKLARGAYILRYVVIDPADLHKTVGSISFGIGVAAPPSESGEQVDGSWFSIGLRVVSDAATLLTVGAVILCGLLVRRGRRDLDHVTRLAVVTMSVVAVGWLALLIADAATVGFGHVRWGSLLLQSDPGRRALVGLQLALGMWWTVRMLLRAGNESARRFVVGILEVIAAAVVLASAYGGHAGIGGSFLVGVILRAVHLGSLCMWIGTLAVMWGLNRRDRSLADMWPSVSMLATIGLAITGASGLLLSGRVASSVTALLGTTYGQRIVIKAGLLVVLAVLGAFAARRVQRGGEPRRVVVELGVAGLAIVIAALLASSAPARGPQFTPQPQSRPQVVTSDLLDLTVSASLEPARPGPNLVQVRVLETRRPSPGPVENVTFRIVGGDGAVVAERQGVPASGLLEWTDINVPSPGLYRVEVDVDRPARVVSPFVETWNVDPVPVPRAERVVSTRSWAPIAAIFAGAWLILVAAGRWGLRRSAGRTGALNRSA